MINDASEVVTLLGNSNVQHFVDKMGHGSMGSSSQDSSVGGASSADGPTDAETDTE